LDFCSKEALMGGTPGTRSLFLLFNLHPLNLAAACTSCAFPCRSHQDTPRHVPLSTLPENPTSKLVAQVKKKEAELYSGYIWDMIFVPSYGGSSENRTRHQ